MQGTKYFCLGVVFSNEADSINHFIAHTPRLSEWGAVNKFKDEYYKARREGNAPHDAIQAALDEIIYQGYQYKRIQSPNNDSNK